MNLSKQVVAIIGGSFNPVHLGHVDLAKVILEKKLADLVAFMPCINHNFGKHLIGWHHRVNMLTYAISDNPNIYTFGFEKNNKLDGKTFNIIQKLKKSEYGAIYDFKYVIGMDCALDMNKWHRGTELMKAIPFIIFTRDGYESPENAWFHEQPHIFLDRLKTLDISSTKVKSLIQQYYCGTVEENIILEYLDEKVFRYIRMNNLYDVVEHRKVDS
jgi:nicotinate-nucleotide adenylyltransferase